jgi:hypothetical protein
MPCLVIYWLCYARDKRLHYAFLVNHRLALEGHILQTIARQLKQICKYIFETKMHFKTSVVELFTEGRLCHAATSRSTLKNSTQVGEAAKHESKVISLHTNLS